MFGSIVASESTGLLRTFSKRESTGLMISVKRAVSLASTAAIYSASDLIFWQPRASSNGITAVS